MDMACFGRNDEDVRLELDRRSKSGIRNLRVSPLFEKGKYYNIDRNSPNYEKEDPKGNLAPSVTHCWIDWESKWYEHDEMNPDDKPIIRWSNETYNFPSLEKAELGRKYLQDKS